MGSSKTAAADNTVAADSPPAAHRPSSFRLVSALAGVLFIWSVNYIVGKSTLLHLDALTLVAFRFELSALLLLAIYCRQPRRAKPLASDLWTFGYLGFFGFAVNQGCFVIGLSQTTSEHSVVIIAAGPVLILLMAGALQLETLTIGKVLGMAISFLGVVLLETESGSLSHAPLLVGDLITLVGVLGFSMYTVLGKRVAKRYDAISMTTFNALVGAILFLPLAVRRGIRLDWHSVGWPGWTGLLYMSALSSVAGYLLFFWALRYMEASRVVVVNYFQPVLVVLLSIPLLGEHPSGRLILSGALVLLGVYLAERAAGQRREEASEKSAAT